MKSSLAITLAILVLISLSCSESPENGTNDSSSAKSDWTESELLSMVVNLRDGMSRDQASAILGEELYELDQGNECIEVSYVKNPDSIIGRMWVSGGPHSFTGLTASFIDGDLVYISLNPGYVDQDRLDAYYEAHPVNHEGSDLRGQKRWELFHETQSSRRRRGEQDGADQPATASESKSEGNQKLQPESEGRSQ